MLPEQFPLGCSCDPAPRDKMRCPQSTQYSPVDISQKPVRGIFGPPVRGIATTKLQARCDALYMRKRSGKENKEWERDARAAPRPRRH